MHLEPHTPPGSDSPLKGLCLDVERGVAVKEANVEDDPVRCGFPVLK